MKISELLREASMKGPGDYWPGDENIPGSPDYDPSAARQRDFRRQQMSRGREEFPEGPITQRSNKPKTQKVEKLVSGDFNGKPYNIVTKIVGPTNEVNHEVRGYMDYNTNIYHKFAGVDVQPAGNGNSVAKIYILAAKGSLIRQHLVRKHKEETGSDYSGGNEFAEEPKPFSW